MKTRRCLKPDRPLEGCCVGISISESNELSKLGFPDSVINATTVDLARRLIALGSTVVLGHNWRPGGVMEAIAKFALAYRDQNQKPQRPLIVNYLAAPDFPSLSEAEATELLPYVQIQTVSWDDQKADAIRFLRNTRGLPFIGNDALTRVRKNLGSADSNGARGRNLAAMRFRLTLACDVRVVIGGRAAGYGGAAPGIIEEIWWALMADKPVLLSTALGGAACAAIDNLSPAAQAIRADTDHPLACVYLQHIQERLMARRGYRSQSRFYQSDQLSSDALIPAIFQLVRTK